MLESFAHAGDFMCISGIYRFFRNFSLAGDLTPCWRVKFAGENLIKFHLAGTAFALAGDLNLKIQFTGAFYLKIQFAGFFQSSIPPKLCNIILNGK